MPMQAHETLCWLLVCVDYRKLTKLAFIMYRHNQQVVEQMLNTVDANLHAVN